VPKGGLRSPVATIVTQARRKEQGNVMSRKRLRRRNVGLGLAAVATGAVVLAAGSATAGATTGPDASYKLRAIMTNSKIVLVRSAKDAQYIKPGGSVASFPRGIVVTFSVTNKGTKPLLPAVHALSTVNEDPLDHPLKYYTAQHAAAPGQTVDLQINFYFRAPFLLLMLDHKKPVGKSVRINVG
jgi:hypothetical protein